MKQFRLTLVLTVLMSMVGLQAFADWDKSFKVNVGSLYYYLDMTNNKAEVTSMPSGNYFGDIEIPSSITYADTNYDVTSIGDFVFYNCSKLTSVTIPNSVTSIGAYAFGWCSGLTSVTIPDKVTSIGENAFYRCTGLTSITIPNNVTSIGKFAFLDCPNLASIVVESGNPNYDSRNDCNAIIETASNTLIAGCKNTIIPNSVASIGEAAFFGCSGLTSIDIPNSVTSIGDEAFDGCSGLTSIDIPNSVTSIGDEAFDGCSGLTSVTIPKSVTSIGNYAFFGCSALTSVTIPNSVTSIGIDAFMNCSGLTSVTIPNSVTSIGGGAFGGCTGITSFIIGNNVTSIGYQAFYGCTGLTSVTIPNSVTSIGSSAFNSCSNLTSITIPNSVTSIGDNAFFGCSALTSVTVNINTPLTISSYTFSNRANATLYVPVGCKSAYEAASYWSEFGTIEEMNPGYVTIAMNAGAGKPRSMVGYSSKYGLDFTGITGIKAYIVCGYNFKKEAMLVHVDVVPPYTGFVIKTTNSIYDGEEFVVPTSTDDYYYANLLLPVVESQTIQPTETIDDVEYTNLMVGILNNEKPGFVRVTSPVVSHNKSYLRVPTSLYNSSASARQLGGISIVFEEDEATGISNLNDNVNDNVDANAPRYNIAGQRVGASYKGVVIQNGKKILIK